MSKTASPHSLAFRRFIREFMLSDRAKQRIRAAILKDNAVLRAAMVIAAGRLDEEPLDPRAPRPIYVAGRGLWDPAEGQFIKGTEPKGGELGSGSMNLNVQVFNAIKSLPPEAREEYARTGRIEAWAWAPDVLPPTTDALEGAGPGAGTHETDERQSASPRLPDKPAPPQREAP